MGASADAAARELIDVVPVVMRTIRAEMRSHRSNDLTVPLFRSLMYIERHPEVSLQRLAEHLGLTSPSACKIVDGLVGRALVLRQHSDIDRRKITLTLTPDGQQVLDQARTSTQARLAELLHSLSEQQCGMVLQAMQVLQPLFQPAADEVSKETKP